MGEQIMSVFAEKIRNLREQRNLTTRMLSEELGISYSQISRYENDISDPTRTILIAYARFFNVTLDYLCDDEKE